MNQCAGVEWIVVGAGFTGATVARRLAEDCGLRVLLVDSRPHLGGNAYDLPDESGLTVHQYGPHIFHTNSNRVVKFLSRFTEWRPYRHRVKALVKGELVPLPFGFDAINALFGSSAARIRTKLEQAYGPGSRVPILKLMHATDQDLQALAQFVFENVFLGYTKKHWGCDPRDLDHSVTGRVPVIVSDGDHYFQDSFQAMPKAGYTALFQRMLDHPNITVALGVRYDDLTHSEKELPVVYTGGIDGYFGFSFGTLQYRSADFVRRTLPVARVQPCAVLNFPCDFAFTRTTEFSWVTGQAASCSVLMDEYPCAHRPGHNEALYPVPTPANQQLALLYRKEAEGLRGRVWFAGRLGDYMYYNMDQACARAHALVDKEIVPFLKSR
jgi:UDP-galactopyranose mutase